MDIKKLQVQIEQHLAGENLSFKQQRSELHRHCSELLYETNPTLQLEKAGQTAVSLLRIFSSQGWDLEQAIVNNIQKTNVVGKKIALIGTSASPITNGHLTMGLEILALTDVDMVWYYLVGKHPWGKKLMPAVHRVEMARLATRRYPKMGVSDFEVVHGDRIYKETMETAELMQRHFLPAYPQHQFCWVMGSDVAQSFHEWSGCEWMAENMSVYIIHRLGYEFNKEDSILAGDRHVYLKEDIVTSNISSTLVRNRGREYNQEKILALVPEVVWDYLVEHRLLDPDVLVL
jgi:nicotinate (nicotinamide) nucleotide adenylyltransferase